MSNVQGLCGEWKWLYFHIRFANAVNETGFSNVWEARDQYSSFVGIDAWEPAQMLPNLLQIGKGRWYFSEHGAHSSQSSPFQGFAPVKGISIFNELQVVFAHVIDHVFGRLDMTQCKFIVIFVVEYVKEVAVEGVDILDFGEVFEDVG